MAARARGRLPVPRDARPADHRRRGQGRHAADASRWTGWSAATSATARPRSRCARRSRRCRTASRSPCWCRPRCWCSSTCSTFAERMSGFPVDAQGALAGSRPTRRPARSIDGTGRRARVDIVIGTHRLLNPDIRVKDLGLIIVDEEQRFGVEHKEQMKRLRTSRRRAVDERDPDPAHPGDGDHRHPRDVHDHHAARGAAPGADLRRRLRGPHRWSPRSGASCCARARSSTSTTGCSRSRRPPPRIRELVPEARVAAAHGQMGEHQLEQVMLDFWEKRFDVLVCTTIVESGLDVSNANTMIIERADTLGLSQLHQLRGRVGRSRERAYAYFLYPAEKPLTETAHERLATLAQHSDLGGGMAIAMKDLEIRGAGNLLGGEQSGHIADVGFDLYVRLVGEAVSEFRGDGGADELDEVRIELPVDAHLPHDYIPSERLRLEMYKRLAEVRSDEDVDLLREEMRRPVRRAAAARSPRCCWSRGSGPAPGRPASARSRSRARTCGSRRSSLPESRVVRLKRLYPEAIVKPQVDTILVPRPQTAVVGGRPIDGVALLEWARRCHRRRHRSAREQAPDQRSHVVSMRPSAGRSWPPAAAGRLAALAAERLRASPAPASTRASRPQVGDETISVSKVDSTSPAATAGAIEPQLSSQKPGRAAAHYLRDSIAGRLTLVARRPASSSPPSTASSRRTQYDQQVAKLQAAVRLAARGPAARGHRRSRRRRRLPRERPASRSARSCSRSPGTTSPSSQAAPRRGQVATAGVADDHDVTIDPQFGIRPSRTGRRSGRHQHLLPGRRRPRKQGAARQQPDPVVRRGAARLAALRLTPARP